MPDDIVGNARQLQGERSPILGLLSSMSLCNLRDRHVPRRRRDRVKLGRILMRSPRLLHRREVLSLGVGAVAAGAVSRATAQSSWPDKPVKVLVPFAAGGGTD